jgi:DNA polymerase-1
MKRAVFDLETNGLLEGLDTIHCAVVKDIDTGEIRTFDPSNIGDLCSHLQTFDWLSGHNCIQFDFPALRKVFGWTYNGEKWDTLLVSRLQRPNRSFPPKCPSKSAGPHSVEVWGYRLGHHKVDHEDWTTFSPEMLHRCVQDVHIQHKILDALTDEGKDEGWERAHKLNHKLFHYLEMQERHGWLVDRHHLDKCLHTLDRWIDRINRAIGPRLPLIAEPQETRKEGEYKYVSKPFLKSGEISGGVRSYFEDGEGLRNVAGPFSRVSFRPVDLDSNKETKAFLLALGWEPLEWNVNNDGERTSPKLSKNDDFNGIQGSLGRLVAKRIQCRQRKGVIEGWRDSIRTDGRISAQVNGVATTGRLKHKGIVNVPNADAFFGKWMRRLFIAQPGWVLVGTDSKGNQMRQLAARMGDEEFTRAVLYGNSKDGTDLHSLNQKRAGVATRTLAKNFFYGCILFGAGDRKTAKILGTSIESARDKKSEYFREMPKLREFLDREIAAWRKTASSYWNPRYRRMEYSNGYITGLDGRPILVEFEKDILVYILQSDEAQHMSAAYCLAHKRMERDGYIYGKDFASCIFYHDEFVFTCREELAEYVAEISKAAIRDAAKFYKIAIEHDGDAKVGKSCLDVH